MRRIESTNRLFLVLTPILLTHCAPDLAPEEPSRDTAVDTPAQAPMAARPAAATAAWSTLVQRRLSAAAYAPRLENGIARMSNPAHGWTSTVREGVLHLGDGPSSVTLSLVGLGREGLIEPVPVVAPEAGDCAASGRLDERGACLRRVALRRPEVTEWWENDERGLEQGFTLPSRPPGPGPLVLEVAVRGAAVEVEEASDAGEGPTAVRLIRSDAPPLRYARLAAWDEAGRDLPAWIEVEGSTVRLMVDDEGAVGEVTVDPTLTAAAWTAESDQANAYFGISVASAGDVNGDGYGDVVVGAPYYTNGESAEGRAFLYLGSSSGLATSAAWTAESNQASAQFGWSVASAGDVNGDGYGDVVGGAPYYTNGESAEGRAFLYLGSASGLAASAAWTAESNQASAQFGWSVASAGDVNGDGYGDVVVGAYAYDNGESNEGRAYIYLGGGDDADGDGWTRVGGDCNDFAASVHPGAMEADADGTDTNCDGTEKCYANIDGDGFRTDTLTTYTVPAGSSGACSFGGRGLATLPAPDCNDSEASVNPGASEVVGDTHDYDENCDGFATCYADADNDGYGGTETAYAATNGMAAATCDGEASSSHSRVGHDCADLRPSIHPGATEVDVDGTDSDCDGLEKCYGNADGDDYRTATLTSFTVTPGSTGACSESGRALATVAAPDCDDSAASVYPGAPEPDADGVDSNCDGSEKCYADADLDGYRTGKLATHTATAGSTGLCSVTGRALATLPASDCNDSAVTVNPGAVEITGDANDFDENCDGFARCYADVDLDGYRGTATDYPAADGRATLSCDGATPTTPDRLGNDCADWTPAIHPGAAETDSDGTDSNCDGVEKCYADIDGDGYRNALMASSTVSPGSTDICSTPGRAPATAPAPDCNDASAVISPGALEIDADGTDSNCDGIESCYADADHDGYRKATLTQYTASPGSTHICSPSGRALATLPATDCNDASNQVYPGAPETDLSGFDANCDGSVICYADVDGDGWRTDTLHAFMVLPDGEEGCTEGGRAHSMTPATDCNDALPSVHPGAPETAADGVDQDCDGTDVGSDAATGWGCAHRGVDGGIPFGVVGWALVALRRRSLVSSAARVR